MQIKEVMVTIKLSGSLAKEFGRVHQRLISTTKEAVHALCATVPGFQKSLNSSKSRGLTFAIFRGKKNIGEDDLGYPVTGEDIHIVPVIIGSKKAGLLQTVMGAALVVVGALTYQYGGAMLVTAGAGMMAGGIMQMLSPQPAGIASKQDAENKASYAFGGATNTTAQGNPVPLAYGKRRIGGAIISAGIYVEDQA
ncbi:tail assembly protein [Pluralibacter gergoviae]|nr:tail assembly protein [Pluralibacter gergoviae]